MIYRAGPASNWPKARSDCVTFNYMALIRRLDSATQGKWSRHVA
jgi:hypothetical protein